MTNWIHQLFGGARIALDVTVDHVELTLVHLVLGLQLQWDNRTANAIAVKDIQVQVYMHGSGQEPLNFYPLERFERSSHRNAIEKSPIRPFTIPAKGARSEQLRFISQEVHDIEKGSYAGIIHLTDVNDGVHENKFKLHIRNEQKYRRTEEWERDE